MTLMEFKKTTKKKHPPPGLNKELKALWLDARGEWDAAHQIVQVMFNREAIWIHAYLHRKESDLGNAAYWYHRCGEKTPPLSLQQEWDQIAEVLLAEDSK